MTQNNQLAAIRLITTAEILPLRRKVLWPNESEEFCSYTEDDESLHYGLFWADKLVSGVSIYIENTKAHLRKFATDQDYQKHSFGTVLLKWVIDDLKNRGVKIIWCNARKTAYKFYEKSGFEVKGKEYVLNGLQHFYMQLKV